MSATITCQPETQNMAFAPLETIDLARLEARDANEIQKLLRASSGAGSFFLDFRNTSSEAAKSLPTDVPKLINISDEYFAQPLAVKMKDFREGQLEGRDRGFKEESECEETFEISYDELADGSFNYPAGLAKEAEVLDRFMRLVQSGCLTMLSCLCDALQLDEGERFEQYHRAGVGSESGLKLIYEPTFENMSDWFDNTHTDTGTFTVLFYDQIGLDVYMREEKTWAYAAVPEPGCAFVNLANAIQRLSSDRLHSPLHRVSQPTDGFRKRYYLSYFLRPEHAIKEVLDRGESVKR